MPVLRKLTTVAHREPSHLLRLGSHDRVNGLDCQVDTCAARPPNRAALCLSADQDGAIGSAGSPTAGNAARQPVSVRPELNVQEEEEDAVRLARYLLEDLDSARWRLVPAEPTRAMVTASMAAMRTRRKRDGRVAGRLKYALRLAAGIEATPHRDAAKQPSGMTLGVDRNRRLQDHERLQPHSDTRNVGTLETRPDELFEEAKVELARYEREGDRSSRECHVARNGSTDPFQTGRRPALMPNVWRVLA